jgi:uncharacterized protein affecting Mg2+/Co2+ transport
MGFALAGGLFAAGGAASGQTAQQAPPETTPAQAGQAAAPAAGQVYTPDFFIRFAPKTAADMVGNIPGFRISATNDSRGFGQASQNVLVNGRRISGKSNDAETALGRIAADTVVRIEILDGATLNIPGLSGQVANVVATVDAFGGSWFWQPEFRENLQPSWFNGQVSANGRVGGWSYSLGINAREYHNGHDGPGVITNGAGQVTDVRTEGFNGAGEQPSLTGTLTYETVAGSVVNLNLAARSGNFVGREDSLRSPVGQLVQNRFTFIGEDVAEVELGGDWEFDLGPGRLKLIGLTRAHEEDDDQTVELYPIGGAPLGQRLTAHEESGESILRSEFGFGAFGGDAQWAVEGAFNYLDLGTDLGSRMADGSYAMSPLVGGTARVEERRAETNISWSRPLSPAWSLQSSLGVEYSELSQTGANGLTREFVRPKGFLALVWHANERLDVSFKGERRVGQLDFGDFLSSVDLQDDNAQAGNVELTPEQSWILSTEVNQNLGAWGAVTGTFEYRRIEDVVDQVPIGVTGSGVGNLDEATYWIGGLKGSINLDPLGARGLQFVFDWKYADSEVADPLTGFEREISGMQILSGSMRLRWDVPGTPWSFQAGLEEYRSAANYRLDQVSYNWSAPSTNFFVIENKDVFGMKARLQIVNLNDSSENFRREVYLNGRRTNPLSFTEERHRTFGPIVRFNLSGTF